MIEKDTQMSSRKIPYAMYSDNWSYDAENTAELSSNSSQVTPSEYDNESMRKKIFCPRCFTPLTRAPLEGLVSTNGISAFFKHLPSYNHIRCLYRAKRGEGLYYDNEEDALAAIENENLVIVHNFKTEEPDFNEENLDDGLENYENEIDATSDVTVSRHKNQTYSLPSKITTIRGGICRRFDRNIVKGYFLPNSNQILPLSDLLNDVRNIQEPCENKKLFIGQIKSSKHLGKKPTGENIRMTYLEFSNTNYKDFCIKTPHSLQHLHGIRDESIGRYVIFYGAITENGIGLCVENLGFGELGLLPNIYNNIAKNLFDE